MCFDDGDDKVVDINYVHLKLIIVIIIIIIIIIITIIIVTIIIIIATIIIIIATLWHNKIFLFYIVWRT